MSQLDDTTLETASDDWGDFGAVISTLEAQESEEVSLEEHTSETPDNGASTEAICGLLNVFLLITEKATSVVTGVRFQFDEADKEEVINAAVPVLNKNGGTVASWLGDYVEEATLLLAVLGMLYTARQSIIALKAEKLEEARKQQQAKEKQDEETAAAEPA